MKRLIITYAPDFCWCTAMDLFLMIEYLFEDVDFNSFKTTLSRLLANGYFIRREWPDNTPSPTGRQGKPPGLYLRISEKGVY
jgi:hypothetical protein